MCIPHQGSAAYSVTMQMLWCLVASIIAIQFCLILQTLTSPTFKRLQNRLARVVTRSLPFSHSVPLLGSLQWLPVTFRDDFKIYLLTYKTLRQPPLPKKKNKKKKTTKNKPAYLHSMFAHDSHPGH